MFHFFPKFAHDVEDMPFARALRQQGVPHRMFAELVDRQYTSRSGLIFRIYPRLFRSAAKQAYRSLARSTPAPDAVVITSDIEALVFGILRAALRRRTLIVFETFIATPRRGALTRRLHLVYYALVLRFVDVAVCHSTIEASENATLFPRARTRFVCLPYSMHVNGREALRAQYASLSETSDVVVAAGRSGRDYATLGQAVLGLDCQLHVICDWDRPVRELPESSQITVLRACFGQDYLAELARARFVVVPLSIQGISAGQMVLLQAFALGKAVIVTDTGTSGEYAEDGREALFVEFGSVADMRRKIETLLGDPALCRRLGENAAALFEAKFSVEAYAVALSRLLTEIVAAVPRVSAESV